MNTSADPATSATVEYSNACRSPSGPRATRHSRTATTAATTTVPATATGQGRKGWPTTSPVSCTATVFAADTTSTPRSVAGVTSVFTTASRRPQGMPRRTRPSASDTPTTPVADAATPAASHATTAACVAWAAIAPASPNARPGTAIRPATPSAGTRPTAGARTTRRGTIRSNMTYVSPRTRGKTTTASRNIWL